MRWSFVTGVNEAAVDWEGGAYSFALMAATWTPNTATDVNLDDINAHELAGGGYAQQSATTKSRSIDLPLVNGEPGYISFFCDDPSFGVITGGDVAAYLVCFFDTGNDATSSLVCAFTILYTADGVASADIEISPNGLLRIGTVCDDFSGGQSEGS